MSKNILVVGAGPGGFRAALCAAEKGACVTLFEEGRVGGRCLWSGCMPVKTLLNFAKHSALPVTDTAWRSFCDNTRQQLEMLSGAMTAQLEDAGVTLRREHWDGSIPGDTDAVILAAGLSPRSVCLPGKTMYTPADFLTMPCLPSRIAVLGAGAAGMEFAQCFALLGVHVTVYEKDKQVLPGAEPAIARRYEGICRELGIDFQFGCAVEESEIPEDVLFSALGLSFPSAPPTVDPKIFYVGDISGLSRTAYEAEAAGRAAIAAIYGETVPSCVPFSVVSGVYDFASIGYSSVHCAEAELAESGYAFMTNRPSGFARLWGDECGCITGAELLLPGAGELAALLALLIEKGIRADELARTAFFHPGYSEILQRAGALLYADL